MAPSSVKPQKRKKKRKEVCKQNEKKREKIVGDVHSMVAFLQIKSSTLESYI